LWPALLACAIYIAIIAMATFEVPAIIGLGSNIFTFSTLVYIQVSPSLGQPNYGIVGALGAFLIVLSLLLSWWYFRVISLSHRYGVIQGRGYTPKVARLGRTKWLAWLFLGLYFCLSKILPLVMMIWAALLPFFQPFSRAALDAVSLDNFSRVDWRLVWDGFINTFILVLTVPSVALVFGLAISWVVVRSGSKASLAYDSLAFLPHAVPNLLFAVAAVIFALFFVPVSFPLYGSLFLIFAIYVVVRISLVTRVLNSAMVQIHKELEEAAAVSGLSTFDTLTRIILPLLLPAIVNLWIWNALLTYRELTMAAFLVTQDNITLPIIVWNLWTGGSSGEAAAVSLVFVVALVPLVALYWGLRSRQGIGVTQA
jgi:iron(III) transport system permease protein